MGRKKGSNQPRARSVNGDPPKPMPHESRQHKPQVMGMQNHNQEVPPPPPPCRIIGVFGETKESVMARRDYEIYMKGWRDGLRSTK